MEMSQLNLANPLSSWELKALSQIHRQMDLSNMANSGRILHYGCGNGYAIMGLPNAVGYEADTRKAQYGIEKGANIFWNKEKLQQQFDIIFCHEKALKEESLHTILPKITPYTHRNSVVLLAFDKNQKLGMLFKDQLKKEVEGILSANNYKLVEITEQYAPNYQKMLIFYRIFGRSFYHKILNLLGRIKGEKRWIVKAIPKL